MIAIEHVGKTYGTQRAVDDLSLTVARGTFCALVGPSGSGKTTTLRMINRLVVPDVGRIVVAGEDIAGIAAETLRRRIGYAIQSVGLFPHWTVEDNIAAVPRLLNWPKPRIAARVEEMLALLKLDAQAYRGRYPHQLSGGQQQRVGFARALAADPELLLMDEPFGALDPITRAALRHDLAALHRATGKTILFVTHDMDEALGLAGQIAVFDQGRLVQSGTPLDIIERPASDLVRDLVGRGELGLRRLALRRVGEAMRAGVAALGEAIAIDASLKDALSQMAASRCEALPVRDANGAVVGVIGVKDIVRG